MGIFSFYFAFYLCNITVLRRQYKTIDIGDRKMTTISLTFDSQSQ